MSVANLFYLYKKKLPYVVCTKCFLFIHNFFSASSEILLEERVSDCETMKRENRRVAAMSWGTGDDTPPPKPTRILQTDSSPMLSLNENSGTPQTYIIAQNATVLAQLLRENENRPLNPSAYTTPASVFNTLAVDIDASKAEPTITTTTTTTESPVLPLKTIILPASELLKLNPIVDDDSIATNISHNSTDALANTNLSTHNTQANAQIPAQMFPIPCEIINTLTQKMHGIDSAYRIMQTPTEVCQNVHYSPNLPPHSADAIQKSRSLERNNQTNVIYASRISSLDRTQNNAQLKQARSNSLTRQLSSGSEISASTNSVISFMAGVRSASLERGTRIGIVNYGLRTNSFECGNGQSICTQNAQYIASEMHRGGSLERNQSMANAPNHIMKTRNFPCGSLDRNHQGTF